MDRKSHISILVIDDEESVRRYLRTILSRDYDVHLASSGSEALEIVATQPIDLVLLDLVLEAGEDGLDLLKNIKSKNEELDVLIISSVKMVKTIVQAMTEGASDYINKPFEREELFLAINRVLQRRTLTKRNVLLEEKLAESKMDDDPIINVSEEIREIKSTITKLKGQHVNVFLVGETGTGKEMFAQSLHDQDGGPERPFISVNCAAIPENLLESVLFGHEKGAFTGATERRIGKFELADGGDIFLDEISSMNLDLQAKLLRVLEEEEVERIGSAKPKKIEFRVISASNEDIVRKVAERQFRSDLFYRLNTVTIQLPTLNERPEDIVPLAEHFLQKYRRTQMAKTLSSEVKTLLTKHHWRGNVRELRNTVENMLIFSKGETIQPDDIPFLKNGHYKAAATRAPMEELNAVSEEVPIPPAKQALTGEYKDLLRDFERDVILKRLEKNRWSKTKTCRDLGITRNKLYRKMAELGIEL